MANSVIPTIVTSGAQSLAPLFLANGTYTLSVTDGVSNNPETSALLEYTDGHRWYPVPAGYCQAGQVTSPVVPNITTGPTGAAAGVTGAWCRFVTRGRSISINIG